MRQAELLIGGHDFRNCCVNLRMKESIVRQEDRIEIERERDYPTCIVHSMGFPQGMLLEVGLSRMSTAQETEVLEGRRPPHRANPGILSLCEWI